MSEKPKAIVNSWLADSMDQQAKTNIHRMSQAKGVKRIAIMPDVHAAAKTCVGAVVATQGFVYPEIVGADIGCGITTVELTQSATSEFDSNTANKILDGLAITVPSNRHRAENCPTELPEELMNDQLSNDQLERLKIRDGRVQLGTLGRGNHFLEIQQCRERSFWLMVHSGSRGMGQAIASWHLARATQKSRGLVCLDTATDQGQAYLSDMAWAIEYARQNRIQMIDSTGRLLERCGFSVNWKSLINSDHNHVRRERHFGDQYWVHRKGAQSAADGEIGLVPGSMGTSSYHVTGRAMGESLNSCSHGAGRRMSRKAAFLKLPIAGAIREIDQVWVRGLNSKRLVEESPSAYKDIRAVMRAQKALVKIKRIVDPVLNYRGR